MGAGVERRKRNAEARGVAGGSRFAALTVALLLAPLAAAAAMDAAAAEEAQFLAPIAGIQSKVVPEEAQLIPSGSFPSDQENERTNVTISHEDYHDIEAANSNQEQQQQQEQEQRKQHQNGSQSTWSLLITALFYKLDQFDVNWFNFILALILIMLMLTTAIGNLFVIVAILIERNLRTIGNYLVLSLAIADLLVACLVMPLASIYQILERWTLGVLLCDIWTSADVFCCTASILHLLAIALDRYWAVTRVDYIRCQRNERRILFMIFFVWMAACIISLAPVFGWKDAQFEWRITNEQECLISQDVGYQIFATCTTFYFPLTLTLIFYWKIYQVARKRIRRKPGNRVKISAVQHPSSSSSNNSPASRRHLQLKQQSQSMDAAAATSQQPQQTQPKSSEAASSDKNGGQIASNGANKLSRRQSSCSCLCLCHAPIQMEPKSNGQQKQQNKPDCSAAGDRAPGSGQQQKLAAGNSRERDDVSGSVAQAQRGDSSTRGTMATTSDNNELTTTNSEETETKTRGEQQPVASGDRLPLAQQKAPISGGSGATIVVRCNLNEATKRMIGDGQILELSGDSNNNADGQMKQSGEIMNVIKRDIGATFEPETTELMTSGDRMSSLEPGERVAQRGVHHVDRKIRSAAMSLTGDNNNNDDGNGNESVECRSCLYVGPINEQLCNNNSSSIQMNGGDCKVSNYSGSSNNNNNNNKADSLSSEVQSTYSPGQSLMANDTTTGATSTDQFDAATIEASGHHIQRSPVVGTCESAPDSASATTHQATGADCYEEEDEDDDDGDCCACCSCHETHEINSSQLESSGERRSSRLDVDGHQRKQTTASCNSLHQATCVELDGSGCSGGQQQVELVSGSSSNPPMGSRVSLDPAGRPIAELIPSPGSSRLPNLLLGNPIAKCWRHLMHQQQLQQQYRTDSHSLQDEPPATTLLAEDGRLPGSSTRDGSLPGSAAKGRGCSLCPCDQVQGSGQQQPNCAGEKLAAKTIAPMNKANLTVSIKPSAAGNQSVQTNSAIVGAGNTPTASSIATAAEGLESKRERKAAKTLAIITGVFVMCWLPFFVMAITMSLLNLRPHKYIFALLLWLGYVNSMLNPIIYTIFSPDFRKAFKRLLCGLDTKTESRRRQQQPDNYLGNGRNGQQAIGERPQRCFMQIVNIHPVLANCCFPEDSSHELAGKTTFSQEEKANNNSNKSNNDFIRNRKLGNSKNHKLSMSSQKQVANFSNNQVDASYQRNNENLLKTQSSFPNNQVLINKQQQQPTKEHGNVIQSPSRPLTTSYIKNDF